MGLYLEAKEKLETALAQGANRLFGRFSQFFTLWNRAVRFEIAVLIHFHLVRTFRSTYEYWRYRSCSPDPPSPHRNSCAADLDCLVSLSRVSASPGMCRPSFVAQPSSFLEIKQGVNICVQATPQWDVS